MCVCVSEYRKNVRKKGKIEREREREERERRERGTWTTEKYFAW